jgi:hypothetical protein
MKTSKIIIGLFFLTLCGKSFSQTSVAQAQAIFIYNFTRFIEWPGEYKTGDFVIGIYGSGELYNEIKSYTSSKLVGNQSIKIVRYTSVQEISKCHIIFVGFGKTKELPLITAKMGNHSTLIITEKKGGLEGGATINFSLVEDKLKFELKSSNANKCGIKISSTLENMAIAKY